MVETTEAITGKSQADIAAGVDTIPRGHQDYYALDIANMILGRLGFMGRLERRCATGKGSPTTPRVNWNLVATAHYGLRGQASIPKTSNALSMRSKPSLTGFGPNSCPIELEDAKSYLTGVLPLALETHEGVASTLVAIEEFGLGLDYLDRYPDIITAVSREQVRQAARSHLTGKTRHRHCQTRGVMKRVNGQRTALARCTSGFR